MELQVSRVAGSGFSVDSVGLRVVGSDNAISLCLGFGGGHVRAQDQANNARILITLDSRPSN